MKNKPDVIKQWIDSVNEEGWGLTAWEKNFMSSIADYFERTGTLSARQEEILERIYTEKVK